MKKIKCGDIVGRKSYNKDIIFLVKDVSDKNNILLEGIFERIIADSSIDDLEIINKKFWGMVDIKNERDINRFTIPKGARGLSSCTEDWDLAVRSFSKDKRVNKIVFTDGDPCPGNMPKEDLRGENVIWLVYGNENFKPCCGRVINVNETQIKKMHQQTDEICR